MPRRRRVSSPSAGLGRSIQQDEVRTPGGGMGRRIYAWPINSDTQYAAGMHAKYTVLLWSTGELSCDCPGWIHYHKAKGELACKHSQRLAESRDHIFRLWQRKEALPAAEQEFDPSVVVDSPINVTPSTSNPNTAPRRTSNLILGRALDI